MNSDGTNGGRWVGALSATNAKRRPTTTNADRIANDERQAATASNER